MHSDVQPPNAGIELTVLESPGRIGDQNRATAKDASGVRIPGESNNCVLKDCVVVVQ